MVEDRRAVLRADVVSLPVGCRRVVDDEEHLEDFLEGHGLRVEGELDHLGVAGIPRADVLVARVRRPSSHIAGFDRLHALQVVVYGFQAPEAASGESGDFLARVGHVVCLFSRIACYFVGSRPTTLQYAEFGPRPTPARPCMNPSGGIQHDCFAQPHCSPPRRPCARRLRPAARHRTRGSHVRGRLLLVHGAPLRRVARGDLHDFGLYGGKQEKSHLRGGLLRDHRPRGGRAGRVRPREGELRKAPGGVLEKRRPHRARPAVLRHRQPVPHGNLLPHRRAETPGRSLQSGAHEDQAFQGRHRHPHRRGRTVLAGRGLSPGFLRQEPGALQVLPHRLRARRQVEAAVGERAALKGARAQRRAEVDQLSPQPPDAEANQPPPLAGYNAWSRDPILAAAVEREGGGWIAERASRMGELVGSERLQTLAAQANRHLPELRTHDRFGNRIDAVEYHPAYHELMALAFGAGLHSLAWTEKRRGAWVARAALNYLWNQGENGVACPVTMTFASLRVLRDDRKLAAEWEPKLLACDYDPRPLPLAQKRAVTIGMAMTGPISI